MSNYKLTDANVEEIIAMVQSDSNYVWLFVAPAPTGSDQTGDGSYTKPYATLEAARDRLRILLANPAVGLKSVKVYLRGGVYERTAAFELGSVDSSTRVGPTWYQAFPGEQVYIIGGKALQSSWFLPVATSGGAKQAYVSTAIWNRIPAASRAHVMVADLVANGISIAALKTMTYRATFVKGSWTDQPAPPELFLDEIGRAHV
jgi:hypothetical protein